MKGEGGGRNSYVMQMSEAWNQAKNVMCVLGILVLMLL